MNRLIHRLKKTTSITVTSSQNCLKCDINFLRCGIERKVGVILRCKVATHNK